MNVNIIVPYRNRAGHLVQFVPHMERFLAGTELRILVIEQADDKPFNRGSLLNAGVSILRDETASVVLHDVDMLPLDSRCDYSATLSVHHLAGAAEQYGFGLPYLNYLGGVLVTSCAAYASVNGYSNRYWGWGSEDDDFLVRLWAHGVPIERRPGRYRSLVHSGAPAVLPNMRRFFDVLQSVVVAPNGSERIGPREFRRTPLEELKLRPTATRVFENDGLSNLSYRVVGTGQLSERVTFPVPISPAHEIVRIEL
jgi:hypothetical protein